MEVQVKREAADMSTMTLFDTTYERRKGALLEQVLKRLQPIYSSEELEALQIDTIDPAILSQRSGRGFVNRDILETVLGNLLECVAPGSHNALDSRYQKREVDAVVEEMADQLYAMIAQSLLAAGEEKEVEERALLASFAMLWEMPVFKERARWNRFASLKDPAVWDAYLLHRCGMSDSELSLLEFGNHIERAIEERDIDHYRRFLATLNCEFAFSYQMQLVMSTYPGWRVLFYHDIAHALTRSGEVEDNPRLSYTPVPLLPRAIAELGGRYYQADLHPETRIGDANFLDHPHRGITTGQTGIIGRGCHLLPCTMGGLSEKVQQRHPIIGDHVFIGTDAGLFGPVVIGDRSIVGPNAEMRGFVELGPECHIGSSVVIATVKSGERTPGKVRLGAGVAIGDGTIVENFSELDLVLPEKGEIPARSHVTNDGFGHPRFVRE
jgi:serine acetyltransferase